MEKPELRKYLKRCPHCHIRFFTDPRNACRDDIGCPFGCRGAQRKIKAAERDINFRNSPKGKELKKKYNDQRPKKGSRHDKPAQEEAPDPDGRVREECRRIGEQVNGKVAQPDGLVRGGVTRSDKPAQAEMAQPDGPVRGKNPRIGEPVREKETQPDKPAQEEATRPDGPVLKKGPRIGEPVKEEAAAPGRPAQEAPPQSDGPDQEKERRIHKPANRGVARPHEPAQVGLAQINGPAQMKGPGAEKSAKRCEPTRSAINYIQIIFRFVDKRTVAKDYIKDLILKMRQRSMDFHKHWIYSFSRAP